MLASSGVAIIAVPGAGLLATGHTDMHKGDGLSVSRPAARAGAEPASQVNGFAENFLGWDFAV
jgi:hypothetical protein